MQLEERSSGPRSQVETSLHDSQPGLLPEPAWARLWLQPGCLKVSAAKADLKEAQSRGTGLLTRSSGSAICHQGGAGKGPTRFRKPQAFSLLCSGTAA